MSPLVLFSARPLPARRAAAQLAHLFLLQTFPFRRRDTALICKKRTVDNIKEKWRASRWGQRTRARWPDRSWGTSECGVKVTGMRGIDIGRRGRQDGWHGSERRKRSEACHVRNGDDSFVCRAISFISDESNSIARAPGDRASASSLRQNVIGYAVNY